MGWLIHPHVWDNLMSCMNTLRILFICFLTNFMTTQDSYCTIWYCEFLHWLYELRETKVQFVRTASSDMAVIHDKQLKIYDTVPLPPKNQIFSLSCLILSALSQKINHCTFIQVTSYTLFILSFTPLLVYIFLAMGPSSSWSLHGKSVHGSLGR